MKNCQTVVRVGSPAQLVPSCVCAMLTDDPGFCTVPEMRGWLGGCCPELCPWRTDVPIESLAPTTQYKLTCDYLPHEEQCYHQGNCPGCEYAEPIISDEDIKNHLCPSVEKAQSCDMDCDTCGNENSKYYCQYCGAILGECGC